MRWPPGQGVELYAKYTLAFRRVVVLTLEQVEAAIAGILEKGQSFSADGVTYTRADLGELQRLRRELQAEAAGSMLSRARFARPRR